MVLGPTSRAVGHSTSNFSHGASLHHHSFLNDFCTCSTYYFGLGKNAATRMHTLALPPLSRVFSANIL